MSEDPKYDQDKIIAHLQAGLPLHSAPDLDELFSHIEAISTLRLQKSQYHFSRDVREEAITQVKTDAVRKLQGLIKDSALVVPSEHKNGEYYIYCGTRRLVVRNHVVVTVYIHRRRLPGIEELDRLLQAA